MKTSIFSIFFCVFVTTPCMAQNGFNQGSAIVWPDLDSWIKYWQAFQNYISSGIPAITSLINGNNSGCQQNSGEISSTSSSSSSPSETFTTEKTSANRSKIRPHPVKKAYKDVQKHKFHAKHNEHNKNWNHERHQGTIK